MPRSGDRVVKAWHSLLGRRYVLPKDVAAALERVFGEPVDGVVIIERCLYARAHRGMCATTRPNVIMLAMDGPAFASNAELLVHEYFHSFVSGGRVGSLVGAI